MRNFRAERGEIDIIAREGDYVVFVEVKTRSGQSYGSPFDAVTPRKQRQISKVAAEYLVKNGAVDSPARFDVVAVTLEKSIPKFELLQNAFEFCYG